MEFVEVFKRYDGGKNGWRVVDDKELGEAVGDWRGEVDEDNERERIWEDLGWREWRKWRRKKEMVRGKKRGERRKERRKGRRIR
jgi:hypothetical protein